MALSIGDIVTLAKQGYKVADVKELIELSEKSEDKKEPAPENKPEDKQEPAPEIKPEDKQEPAPEKSEDKQDPKKSDDQAAEYKKQIEELQKQIKELQSANTRKDASGGADQKTSEQIFLDAARGLLS